VTRCVVIAVAIALAAGPAWGHSFPPVRTVVAQVDACEVALLVGFRPGSGDPTERILARAVAQPAARTLDALRTTMTTYAMAPLSVTVGGTALVPTNVRAKLALDDGGRPTVFVLVTYAIPRGGGVLAIASKDPGTTRISWQDLESHRVDLARAPAQSHWHDHAASFLLSLAPSSGGSACVRPTSP
jgi:hypothetical protein